MIFYKNLDIFIIIIFSYYFVNCVHAIFPRFSHANKFPQGFFLDFHLMVWASVSCTRVRMVFVCVCESVRMGCFGWMGEVCVCLCPCVSLSCSVLWFVYVLSLFMFFL